MAASMPVQFDSWLSGKLRSLNTDEGVFGTYIKGILEGDESQEEKLEALEGILTEILPEDGESLSDICKEILTQWNEFFDNEASSKSSASVDVDTQIARIMEQQAQIVVPQKKYTEEEKKLRQTILAQYAEVSDGEEEEEEETGAAGGETGEDKILLSKNTNAEEVAKAERAKKEKLRQDAQKKKEKDKEDREKQKNLQQERKDKEKKRTQKSERKR
nr:EOG090X0H15 [Eulimnadia texana]